MKCVPHITLLDTGTNIAVCQGSRELSALALAFCSAELPYTLECGFLSDQPESDHYPVNVHIMLPSLEK